jgi:putative endonuclease
MENENKTPSYTYILRCADGTYYTGWTNHLEERVKTHNAGKGARYTRPRRPVTLVYYETFSTKEEAMSREFAIKRLKRQEKQKLVDSFSMGD